MDQEGGCGLEGGLWTSLKGSRAKCNKSHFGKFCLHQNISLNMCCSGILFNCYKSVINSC